jgi:hypothetical protein
LRSDRARFSGALNSAALQPPAHGPVPPPSHTPASGRDLAAGGGGRHVAAASREEVGGLVADFASGAASPVLCKWTALCLFTSFPLPSLAHGVRQQKKRHVAASVNHSFDALSQPTSPNPSLFDSPSAPSLVHRLHDHVISLRIRGNRTQQTRRPPSRGPDGVETFRRPTDLTDPPGGPCGSNHRATWSHVLCIWTFLCGLTYPFSPIPSSMCFRQKYCTVRLHAIFSYCTITNRINNPTG